jgi:succinate dehydrogenase / fumarate reductase cytochrome b subunit
MSSAETKANRPLSPHLTVYRWQMTMAMSIVHRITGLGLYFGTLILAAWLVAAASGPGPYDAVTGLLTSWPGLVILFGYSWALIHHLLGGLRHFVWDFGRGLGKPARDQLAIGNLFASIILTIALWAFIVWFG